MNRDFCVLKISKKNCFEIANVKIGIYIRDVSQVSNGFWSSKSKVVVCKVLSVKNGISLIYVRLQNYVCCSC